MTLPTSNNLTLTGDARAILIALADEYQNNYLTPAGFANTQGLTEPQARQLIELAQQVRASPHPEE